MHVLPSKSKCWLAVTVTQNKEEVKLEKEAAKQEKAQEKLEREQFRDHNFNQFNRTSGLVHTMYRHIRHTHCQMPHTR